MFIVKHGFFMRLPLVSVFAFLVFSSCYSPQPKSGFKTYEELKVHTQNYQVSLKAEYAKANSRRKKVLVGRARDSVLSLIVKEYFNYWKGTAWGFNGTTQKPKKGKIACGYFITTLLEDVGFKVQRVKWAQAASETMIKKMTNDIKRFSNQPVKTIEKYIEEKGKGLYIVGLDNHTGFIYNDGGKIRFVHSNFYKPEIGVMEQELNSHNPLKDSKYRVIGKILDEKMMKKWIKGEKM